MPDALGSPLILFYNTFFDDPYSIDWIEPAARGAFVHDKALYPEADAVIFHIPDLVFGTPTLDDVAKLQKPEKQLWVAWSKESAVNYPVQDDPAFMARFDLEMGYRRSADVWDPYVPSKSYWLESIKQPLPAKTERAPLVMFQSAGFNKSLRSEFATALMQEIQVDSYGRHLNNKTLAETDKGVETKLATISRYKFCLSLENAIEDDYVTEKFFDPFLVGSTPVYRGAPNIMDFAPGNHCFINANDFGSPKDLANYLKYLDENDGAYQQYFSWREQPPSPSFEKLLRRREKDSFSQLVEEVTRRMALNPV